MSNTEALRAAAHQALAAMEKYPVTVNHWKAVLLPAADALRAALAQQPAAPLSERDMLRLVASATTRANEFSDDGQSAQQPAASGEPVAWQQQYIDPSEGAGPWQHCDDNSRRILAGRSDYRLRPLYAAPQPAPADSLESLRAMLAEAVEKLTAAPPQGMALVPVALTEAMHQAGVRTIVRCTGNDDWPPRVWAAMLAAAPGAAS